MKILVKWPTRGCPEGFEERFKKWYSTQSGRHQIRYLFTVDQDDAQTLEAVEKCQWSHDPYLRGATVGNTSGFHIQVIPAAGKIAACNSGINPDGSIVELNDHKVPIGDWDVLILASDDFSPEVHGWDDVVVRAMTWHFPAMDGLLHFPDAWHSGEGYTLTPPAPGMTPIVGRQPLVTIPIMGINYYKRFGYVYHPAYKSEFCDNEQTWVSTMFGKRRFIDVPIFRHFWRGYFNKDATNHANLLAGRPDRTVFEARKANNFDRKKPRLSILVCALERRREESKKLFDEIYRQIFALPDPWTVELHVLLDEGHINVGEKRNILMARANGDYLCFVDDDDWVAPNYIQALVKKCDGGTDCVVFGASYTCDGKPGRPFDFDLKYPRYADNEKMFERTPNHLTPIKSSIAKSIVFPNLTRAEDNHYAVRVRRLLKSQSVCVGNGVSGKDELYHYRFNHAGTATESRRTP